MFKRDQQRCMDLAAHDPGTFIDTIMFVAITVRLQTGVDAMYWTSRCGEDFWHKYRNRFLVKGKWQKSGELERAHELMFECLKIPGLNTAKAGFLVQLLIGESWCADVNNLKWFGVDYRKFIIHKNAKRNYKTLQQTGNDRRKIYAYLRLGMHLGGTEYLWNNWCTQISEKYPNVFPDPQDVSALHWRVHGPYDGMPF